MNSLDTLIASAQQRAAEAQAIVRQERAVQEHAVQVAAVAQVRSWIEAALSVEVRDALAISVRYDADASYKAAVVFTDAGGRWALKPWFERRQQPQDTPCWTIAPPAGFGHDTNATSQQLGERILLLLGQARATAQQRAEQQAKYQAEQDRMDAERKARWEADVAADARCQVRIAQATEQAQRELWRWPEGQAITIYHWRWCTSAPAYGDDGPSAEYDNGWSTQDRLDGAGYVPFEAEIYQNACTLRLDMQAHKPVVERHTIRSFDALPTVLQEHVSVVLPGIAAYNGMLHEEAGEYPISIGKRPVAWVRALLEPKEVTVDQKG